MPSNYRVEYILDALQRRLDKFSFTKSCPLPFNITLSPRIDTFGNEYCSFRIVLPIKRVGSMVSDSLTCEEIASEEDLLLMYQHSDLFYRRVRDMLRFAWMHELDESIVIDGHRPFDPHLSDKEEGLLIFDERTKYASDG